MKRCNVINCRNKERGVDYTVYIGRPSRWGNPFEIGVDGCRADVIAKYREYVMNNKELLYHLHELKWQTLGCWCKPENCHGDVLVELVSKLEDEEILEKREALKNNIKNVQEDIEKCYNEIRALNKKKSGYEYDCGQIGHVFQNFNDEGDFGLLSTKKCVYCGREE